MFLIESVISGLFSPLITKETPIETSCFRQLCLKNEEKETSSATILNGALRVVLIYTCLLCTDYNTCPNK